MSLVFGTYGAASTTWKLNIGFGTFQFYIETVRVAGFDTFRVHLYLRGYNAGCKDEIAFQLDDTFDVDNEYRRVAERFMNTMISEVDTQISGYSNNLADEEHGNFEQLVKWHLEEVVSYIKWGLSS